MFFKVLLSDTLSRFTFSDLRHIVNCICKTFCGISQLIINIGNSKNQLKCVKFCTFTYICGKCCPKSTWSSCGAPETFVVTKQSINNKAWVRSNVKNLSKMNQNMYETLTPFNSVKTYQPSRCHPDLSEIVKVSELNAWVFK